MKNKSYKEFYHRTIKSHKKGLKLVPGGTGLGKSSAIDAMIKDPDLADRKFVYLANRKQLLAERVENLAPERYCMQHSDIDILRSIDSLEPLFEEDFIKYVNEYPVDGQPENIKNISKRIKHAKKAFLFIKKNSIANQYPQIENLCVGNTQVVMNFFKDIIKFYYAESRRGVPTNNSLVFKELCKKKLVCQLFPYLEFTTNPDKRLFLATIHKCFHGVFNGEKNINIFSLKNGKTAEEPLDENSQKEDTSSSEYIIFLDEFDFLEKDLLNLLCSDHHISHAFDFVERFYTTMKRKKLPFPEFLIKYPDYRKKIQSIVDDIDLLEKEYKIPYPDINHFVCSDSNLKDTSVFQTRNTMTKKPIVIDVDRREGSFDLKSYSGAAKDQEPLVYVLLNTVRQAIVSIVWLFQQIQMERENVYLELVRQCFGFSDTFKEHLQKIKQRTRTRAPEHSSQDKFMQEGFGLYEIIDNKYHTDPEEVEISLFSLYTTPEKILLGLTQDNLVFGLSATAIFPRTLGNFDINWIKEQGGLESEKEKDKRGVESYLIPLDEEDEILIEEIGEAKQKIRDNNISLSVVKNSDLGKSNNIDSILGLWIDNENPDDEQGSVFENGKSREFRIKRVLHFFDTLDFIMDNNSLEELKTDSHLLFFASIRQLKYVFQNMEAICDDFEIMQVAVHGELKQYDIDYRGQSFSVVFFEAKTAKDMHANEAYYKAYYNLFFQEKPILFVTTYASASNGVNLQHYSSKKRLESDKGPDRDFKNIHLLDEVYYYFSTLTNYSSKYDDFEVQVDRGQIIKENVHKVSKLFFGKKLSRNDFNSKITHCHSLGTYNKGYRETEDGLINRFCVIIQTLGRIERSWSSMPNQRVRLTEDIYKVLEKFILDEELNFILRENEHYLSQNMKAILIQVEKRSKANQKEISRKSDDSLKDKNQKSINSVKSILRKLTTLRAGKLSRNDAKKVREEWNNLSDMVLRHDFEGNEMKSNSTFFRAHHFNHGVLKIDKNYRMIPLEILSSDADEWDNNAFYNIINKNTIIRGYFELKGYELAFGSQGYFFTPYVYQAILLGRIGEECVKAILGHPAEYDDKNHRIELGLDAVPLSSQEIPDELFELADLKVKGNPWFIDCKNYSETTLQRFSLDKNDVLYRPKLNDKYFKESAIRKLASLREYYNQEAEDCKIIYINVFADEDRPKRYYDKNFKEVEGFKNAQIIVVQGMINRIDKNRLLTDFKQFISDLNEAISK